jgi:hypothetical protein
MFEFLLSLDILADGFQELLDLLVKDPHVLTFYLQKELEAHVFSLFDPAEDGRDNQAHNDYGDN